VKKGTGDGWSLKQGSEFEEQGDSFDEIGLITKNNFGGNHSPMNLETARNTTAILSDLRLGLCLPDLRCARALACPLSWTSSELACPKEGIPGVLSIHDNHKHFSGI
jgi:hypothetical protein